jgi:prevent-host-death family protein
LEIQVAREVGAYEAKTRLPQLLREVAKGQRVTITLRGRPVAELIPPRRTAANGDDAVAAMHQFARVKGVAADTISEWIGQGRE